MSDAATPQKGDLIAGRYREKKKIGSGGMSVVMLAEDTVLQRDVAIKLLAEHLTSDQDFVTRFQHEALAVAKLQHPNIVQVYDSGSDPATNRHFIVMEYVDGTTLSDMLRGGRKLEAPRAIQIGAEACEALECAHRAGVIHRDVKPGNLMVNRRGVTKLTDFGIAKASEMTRVTQVGSVLGTVAYLSPEQATGGETGPQSDIYSLAVVVFEMLAGRLPYLYKSITELAMKQRDELPTPLTELNPEVPVELDHTIRVALSHDPKLRFATAHEFGVALRQSLERNEPEFVTRVMAGAAAANRAGGQHGREDARTRVAPSPVATPTPQQHDAAPAASPTSRRLALVGLVVALLAAAMLAGALFGSSDPSAVNHDSVQSQIEGMRDFVEQNR